MSRTHDEVKRDIKAQRDLIRCILSDAERDVLRVEREHREAVDALQAKLERLQHKRLHGRELLEAYRLRVAELKGEYEALHNKNLIKRLADLVEKIREAGGCSERVIVNPVIELTSSIRERMNDIRALIRGYDGEIKVTQKALSGSFEQDEARLAEQIERRKRQFAEFLRHVLDPWACQEECWMRIRELQIELETVKKTGKVRQLADTMSEIEQLMAELGAEKVAAALEK
jgi:hypothetical protein